MRQRALLITAISLLLVGCAQPTATPEPTDAATPQPDIVVPTAQAGAPVDPMMFQLVMLELYDESLIGPDVVGTCQNEQCTEGALPEYEDDFFDPILGDEIFIDFNASQPTRAELRLLPWVDGAADRANPAATTIISEFEDSTLRWTPDVEPGRYVMEALVTWGNSAATLWWPVGIGIDPPEDEDE